MSETASHIFSTPNICENNEKFVRQFLQIKGVGEVFIAEIFMHGLTDEIITKLECQGFSYEDIVIVSKAFKEEVISEDVCNCTFPSETEVSSRQSNIESDYLREYFGTILPTAMREIATKKPYNPIEYLGQWLLYYRECEEREKRRKEFEMELFEERLKWLKPDIISLKLCGEEEEFTEDIKENEETIGEQ